MDYINVENDCDLDSEGLVPWMIIRAGQPSKFKEIRMVGSLYDKNGQEVLGGGGGGITEYSTLFVNGSIQASAPPVYKTLAEVATVVLNNTSVAYDVKLLSDVTVTGLVIFRDTTRLIGVGENRRIYIGDNGLINDVSEYVNIRFEINSTVTPANLFNNQIPAFSFTDCIFADNAGTKNVAVFMLLHGSLNFRGCTFLGFTGPNKDFVTATNGLLDVVLENTILPESPVCLFKFTDPTIGNMNSVGTGASRVSITENSSGNYRIVFYQDLEDHSNVLITNPETTHALMYDGQDSNWKNRKIAMSDIATVNNLSSAMTLTYDAGNSEWKNNYTSESSTIYTLYTDNEVPNPLKVPQGQVMFLNNSNVPVGTVTDAVKVFVSFYNQSGVNLYGTGYLEGITQGSSKYNILVKSLIDSGEYLRAYIVNSVENAILEQWELDISVPSSTSVFTLDMAVAVSIEHYPLLEKQLDVAFVQPIAPSDMIKWNGSAWVNVPFAHTHNLTNDIIPDSSVYDLTAFNLYNADLLAVVASMNHQWIPPDCDAVNWPDSIGAGTYSNKYSVTRTDSYYSVPSVGFGQLGGHVSFNTQTNIDFSQGVTLYMVYHDCDLMNYQQDLRLLHGAVDPNFTLEFSFPTNFCLFGNSRPGEEIFQFAYSDIIGSLVIHNFTPPFTFTEGFNKNLNIMIIRYDPNTTTLSVDINGAPKKIIVHNFNSISCPYWGVSGLETLDGQPAINASFMPNLLEFGSAGYIDDPTTALMYNTISSYYSSLGYPANNTVATFQTSDNKIHMLPVSYNNLTDVPADFVPSAHQHVVADITDLAVESDGTTIKGNGSNLYPLKTNSYSWTFSNIYDHGSIPHLNPGYFAIDPTNRYLLLNHTDNNSVNHHDLLLSMEFLSQIILKISNTLRNRYCVAQYTDDIVNNQIEISWQNDSKLTVLEELTTNLGLMKPYELEFIRTPGTNLDALADVAITNPTDGQLLEYDTILGWQNVDVPYLPLGTTSTLYQGDVVAYDAGNTEWRNSDNVIPIWKDLYGLVSIRGNQGNPPSLQACDANSKFYEYATASNGLTDMYFEFHMNHDYKLGSDLYFHVHHMTNTDLNGNLRVDFTADVSLAQLSYSGSTNPSNSKFFQEAGGAVTLSTISHTYDATPIYRHVVTEVQLSSNGGSATTLDSAKINVDSLILVRLRRNAGNGTDTATNNYVFVLQSDIHFQSARIGTLRRLYDTNTFSFIV